MATMKVESQVMVVAKFGIPSIHAFTLPTTTATSSPSTLTARRHLHLKPPLVSHRVWGLTPA